MINLLSFLHADNLMPNFDFRLGGTKNPKIPNMAFHAGKLERGKRNRGKVTFLFSSSAAVVFTVAKPSGPRTVGVVLPLVVVGGAVCLSKTLLFTTGVYLSTLAS